LNKIQKHREICNKLNELYKQKNESYGDSFEMTRKLLGKQTILVRLYDKVNRLYSLLGDKNVNQVYNESVEDTLLDLANYAILELIELSNEKENSKC